MTPPASVDRLQRNTPVGTQHLHVTPGHTHMPTQGHAFFALSLGAPQLFLKVALALPCLLCATPQERDELKLLPFMDPDPPRPGFPTWSPQPSHLRALGPPTSTGEVCVRAEAGDPHG